MQNESFSMSPEQCRAARGLLGWSQKDLGAAVGLSAVSVRAFEKGGAIRASNAARIIEAFRAHGVALIGNGESSSTGGPGVRLASAQPDAD